MNKSPLIIVFLGMDGSGKTTLSRHLYEELKERGYNVSYIWWLEGEDSIIKKLLRKIGNGKIYASKEHGKGMEVKHKTEPIRMKLFRIFWPQIVMINYLRFGIKKIWLPKIKRSNEIIIFDRYIYDIILGLSREFDFKDVRKRRMLKVFSKLLPRPDIIFIINVPPEISYLRKKEEIKSIENARRIWNEYQRLYSLLDELVDGKIVNVDNTRKVLEIKADILGTVTQFLKRC